MTLYYSIVFALLILEMAVFIILVLPLPYSWRKQMFKFLSENPAIAKIQYGLKITFIFVFILFIDAINRAARQSESASRDSGDPYMRYPPNIHTETQVASRRFYNQRNMYLTGFTLFLSLILNRTYSLILELLHAEEQLRTIRKQAAAQSTEYLRMVEGQKDLFAQIQKLQSESTDVETLKKQAKQQADEYMRLADRYNEAVAAKSDKKRD